MRASFRRRLVYRHQVVRYKICVRANLERGASESMTIELIGIIALLIGAVSIFCEPAFIVRVFFCSTLLGSAAAVTLPALGDTNIQPAHLLLGFLAFKLIGSGDPERLKTGLAIGRPGFWLMLALIW